MTEYLVAVQVPFIDFQQLAKAEDLEEAQTYARYMGEEVFPHPCVYQYEGDKIVGTYYYRNKVWTYSPRAASDLE